MIVQSNGADFRGENSRKDGEKELERYMSTLLGFEQTQCLPAPSAGPPAQRSETVHDTLEATLFRYMAKGPHWQFVFGKTRAASRTSSQPSDGLVARGGIGRE
jgi:hypothetical protein